MGIPGTGGQLLILVLFVLPGSVYQATRSRLRGPTPADQEATNKILRALAVSTGLNAVYLAVLGDKLLKPLQSRSLAALEEEVGARYAGFWALVLLFAVPMALAGFDYWRTRWVWLNDLQEKNPKLRLAYDPTPRAWDYAFTDIEECFVRVKSGDGTWAGGWFGRNSFAASYPEPLELFIEDAWIMDSDGTFKERLGSNRGIYIRCEDVRAVEFLAREDAAGDTGVAEQPAPSEYGEQTNPNE